MKRLFRSAFYLILFISLQLTFAQKTETTPIGIIPQLKLESIQTQLNSHCSIGEPFFPNPPNGTFYVPITNVSVNWENGSEAINVELWFGPSGNVVKVYDGPAITSYNLPVLYFYTIYQWYVVCKDSTSGIQGPLWSFTTVPNPYLGGNFYESFDNMNCWTPIGPFGISNWSISNTNIAGGSPPAELKFSWNPDFTGESKLLSCDITASAYGFYYLHLDHFCDWYSDPAPFMGIGISYDNGYTYSVIWQFQPVGGDVGPESIGITFTPTENTFQFVLFHNGDSYNLNYWYVDDIWVTITLSGYLPPNPPSNLTAQVINNPGLQVRLNWQDNSWDERAFRIFRKHGLPSYPDEYILVGTAHSEATQFIDATVFPESTYTYRVFAYNIYGSSGSNTTSINVPIPVEFISFSCEVGKKS